MQILQNGILRMIEVLNTETGQDISLLPMTGCAGGAAGGLRAAVGAALLPGAHEVLEMLKFVVGDRIYLDIQSGVGKTAFWRNCPTKVG